MDEFQEFMKEFYKFTGIDLQSYKRPQMERRLNSLRVKHAFLDFRSLSHALKHNSDLLSEFLDRMTINVSEFFRNPERWEALLPHLQQLSSGRQLKFWSAACSTGEEPYTLAMLMEERILRPFQLLATDIDRKVLQQAQTGEYKVSQLEKIPQAYRSKYFTEGAGSGIVKPILKKSIQYRLHNLLADPYPVSLDLIICRNVLIYFTDEAKKQVIDGFARSLNPGGLLFVGSTEQLLWTEENQFQSVSPFIYRKV
ncbi:protein-glutamate O-methyltransferase CheR [Alicyclobacillus tolerans]|uniref:CheR family methyltransferase n=1 Tax=Alicyclobacillus tolerans TaxID=90970 RepID=UPI001F22F670|nr:protein-glutamate O-methyltransferase CheR [Alicyclobacillus tolerans]MCF8563737.1 protein-glutamate O-methyltransferase CheR [Alicyclobacillus tolerans]